VEDCRTRARERAGQGEAPVDEVLESVIRAIAGAMEVREQHSAHHQQNVAHLCDCIAREIGMSDFERRGLAIGASIHDIGKLTVPAKLLVKAGGVSEEEFGVLQTHAEVGADLFRKLQLPWPIVDMIAQHHERLDGSGYPRHLRRDDICEGARIIAIADTYDAMASDRPYRRARGTQQALEALRAGRGRQFDAHLVDAFLRCASADPGFGGRYRAA
jgi:putative nucleotidyltransferase with HDIG domain